MPKKTKITAAVQPPIREDWIDAISKKAEVSRLDAEECLTRYQIRPNPVTVKPKRLCIKHIHFSGTKTGLPSGNDAFEFDWSGLTPGFWGLFSDENFRGKSTIFEMVKWLLRGRPSSVLQEDVKRWIAEAFLVFELGGNAYRVELQNGGTAVAGHLSSVVDKVEHKLATFNSEREFESVMSSLMMKELDLDVVKAREKTIIHDWPMLSGVFFIGTNYSSLLGDVTLDGLPIRLIQMFIGLPWISTISAVNTSVLSVKSTELAKSTELKATKNRVEARVVDLQLELDIVSSKLALAPSLTAVRIAASGNDENINVLETKIRQLSRTLIQVEANRVLAEDATFQDQKEKLVLTEAAEAGAIFRRLNPTNCPRCEDEITPERQKQEKEKHSCSVCGSHIMDTGGAQEALATISLQLKASKAALEEISKSKQQIEQEIGKLNGTKKKLYIEGEQLQAQLKSLHGSGDLEREAIILAARIQEALRELPEQESNPASMDLAILEAAQQETKERIGDLQVELFQKVSEKILIFAKSFGMTNLTEISLKGNANLAVVKSGEQTSFGKLTMGEKLRIKVATVLAMLSVSEERKVGRHPGLLFIDSPAAQEVAPDDLEQLTKGLALVVEELPFLQVFVSSIASSTMLDHIPETNRVYATEYSYLW